VSNHPIAAILLSLVMIAFAAAAIAGQRNPSPKVKPAVALVIIQNPGKDGVIWSVGFQPGSQTDINRRVRVKDQAEAEKMVALLQETAPGRYVYAGLVVI